jgi:peptidylprolyl isomerase
MVKVRYKGWTKDGHVFDQTPAAETATFPVDAVIPGWTEGVQLMVTGETRRMWIPANLAYGEHPRQSDAPAGDLTFDVELIDVKAAPPAPPVPTDVAAPPASAKKTASGLAYRVLTHTTDAKAAKPTATSLVTVNYTGWTTDGAMFDSSIVRGEPATFPLDHVIPGWTEGVQLMKVGDTFWIPGKLAYDAPERTRPGAPRGTLVFDVELLGTKPASGP